MSQNWYQPQRGAVNEFGEEVGVEVELICQVHANPSAEVLEKNKKKQEKMPQK